MIHTNSAKVDHMRLVPGIYVSNSYVMGSETLTTFDIRVKRPNFEDAMSPEISHTIEHFGRYFLHKHPVFGERIVYFGPMGSLTGFTLILNGNYVNTMKPVIDLVLSMMKFIVDYNGNAESIGFDAESCGNYKLYDITGAKTVCANFIVFDEAFDTLMFEYPTAEKNPSIATSTRIFNDDKINRELKISRTKRQPVDVDYNNSIESKSFVENSVQKKEEKENVIEVSLNRQSSSEPKTNKTKKKSNKNEYKFKALF